MQYLSTMQFFLFLPLYLMYVLMGPLCQWIIMYYTDLRSKIRTNKISLSGYFVGAEHEYDTKNCCLALVSKIQEAAFMYSAFRFQNRV